MRTLIKRVMTLNVILGLALVVAALAVNQVAPDYLAHVGAGGLAVGSIVNANLPLRFHSAILDTIDPASKNAGAYSTSWISAAVFEAYQAALSVGVMGALATVDMKLEQATDAAGTGVKDVTSKSITQLTAVASPTVDANNRQATIDCRQEELDIANGFNYVRATVTVGVAATILQLTLRGFAPTYGPANTYADPSVAQQV